MYFENLFHSMMTMHSYWLVTTVILCLYQLGSSDILPDYILRHLETDISHKVKPCTNFYRHVCPSSIHNRSIIDWMSTQIYEQWKSEGEKIVEKDFHMEEEIDVEYLRGPDVTEKLKAFGASGELAVEVDKIFGERLTFISLLRDRASLIYAISQENHPWRKFDFKVIDGMVENILETWKKELEASEHEYSEEVVLEWREQIKKIVIQNGLREETLKDARLYMEWYKEANNVFFALLKTFGGVTNTSVPINLEEIDVRVIITGLRIAYDTVKDRIPKDRRVLIEKTGVSDFLPSKEQDLFKIGTMLLIAVQTKPPTPILYGALGAPIAQKLQHSLLDDVFHTNNDEASEQVKIHKKCTRELFQKMCFLQKEGQCYTETSEAKEIREAAMTEGTEIAYKAMVKALEGEKKKKTDKISYGTLDLTNEQAFFYAYGIRNCQDMLRSQQQGEYSTAIHASVNAPLSQMKIFSEVFQCHRFSTMSQHNPDCNYYGMLIR